MNTDHHDAEALNAFLDAYMRGGQPVAVSDEERLVQELATLAAACDPVASQVARISARLEDGGISVVPEAQSQPLHPPVTSTSRFPMIRHQDGWNERPESTGAMINSRAERNWQRDRRLTLVAVLGMFVLVGTLIQLVAQPASVRIHDMASSTTLTPTPVAQVQASNPLPVLTGAFVSEVSDATLDRMWDTGLRWISTYLDYQLAETEGALRQVASFMERAHAHSMGILVQVGGSAREAGMAQQDGFAAFATFLGDLAALKPDAIEIWPEANLDRSWPAGEISPASYVEMLRTAHEAIERTNPDVYIITGAPAPTRAQSTFPGQIMNDDAFYEGLAEAGAAHYADCIGVQYVEGAVGPTQTSGDPRDDYGTRYLGAMLQRAAAPFRDTTIPVCLTSLGYLSWEGIEDDIPSGWEWASTTTVTNQSEWLAQAIQTLAEMSSVRVALVNLWRFDTMQEDQLSAGYAMIRPDGSCPACNAISTLGNGVESTPSSTVDTVEVVS